MYTQRNSHETYLSRRRRRQQAGPSLDLLEIQAKLYLERSRGRVIGSLIKDVAAAELAVDISEGLGGVEIQVRIFRRRMVEHVLGIDAENQALGLAVPLSHHRRFRSSRWRKQVTR